ncbi:MAG TPA: lytic transglycosylase domain-containing protein [Candidatus Eremiobacteraceae bacterium]
MSIDPSAITSIITYVPKLYDTNGSDGADAAQESGPTDAPGFGDLDALERRFNAMIADLSKQLAAFESSFTRAMGELVKGYQSATPPSGPVRPVKFASTIADAAKRNEIDPALLSAVIGQESGFQPRAVSSAGAMGLMQLMPDTARGLGVRDPFDPAQNVEGGAKYLRGLIDRYHGRLDYALAAYNAGPGAVDKYGGVPPYPETQAYVKNILSSYRSAALTT